MFRDSNKIIIIDDNEKDLKRLSSVFHDRGIGCRTFVYDAMFDQPLLGVRVLFLDINLNGATKPDQSSQRNNTLKDAIENYIHEDNGPFILVFWTSNVEWQEQFCTYVNQRIEHDCSDPIIKRAPYFISIIDKNEFVDDQIELDQKIQTIFNTPTVKTLLDFESLMEDSAWRVMSEIIDIIPKGNKWGEIDVFDSNAKEVFAKIAISTLGFAKAKKNPDLAIKEAIAPLFLHQIANDESNNVWGLYLDNLVKSPTNTLKFPKDFNEGIINTAFHISIKNVDSRKRGAVCYITGENQQKIFSEKFDDNFDSWVEKFTTKGATIGNLKLIAVEFSAACDYIQDKRRTNKYILGVIIPYNEAYKPNCDLKIKQIGDNIYHIPHKFIIDSEDISIFLDLNHTFTLPKNLRDILEPRFLLKKELMDMIGNKYANHISRIGITGF